MKLNFSGRVLEMRKSEHLWHIYGEYHSLSLPVDYLEQKGESQSGQNFSFIFFIGKDLAQRSSTRKRHYALSKRSKGCRESENWSVQLPAGSSVA